MPLEFAGWEDTGQGTGLVIFNDGTKQPVLDPDGAFKAEVLDVVSKLQGGAGTSPVDSAAMSSAAPSVTPVPVDSSVADIMTDAPSRLTSEFSPGGTAAPVAAPAAVAPFPPAVVPGSAPAAPPEAPAATGRPLPTPSDGMVVAQRDWQGYAPESEAAIQDATTEQQAAERTALEERKQIQDQILERRQIRLSERSVELGLKEMELADQKQRRDEALAKAQSEYSRIAETPIRDEGVFEGRGLLFALVAAIGTFAGTKTRHNNGGKNQMLEDLRKIQETDLQLQRENKSSLLNRVKDQVGDARIAQQIVENKMDAIAIDRLKLLERIAETQDEKAALAGVRSELEAKQAAKKAEDTKALARKFQQTEAVPKPVGGPGEVKLSNETTRAIEGLGINTKLWNEALGEPVVPGQNTANVAQATREIIETDNDVNTLQAIMDANGGDLPTTGVIRVPKFLQDSAARMGLRDGQDAEEVTQLMSRRVTQRARSYGGAVTEADADRAQKEFGVTGKGFIRGLKRERDRMNNGVAAALGKRLPGVGQQALDIYMKDVGRTYGVAAPKMVSAESEVDKQPAPERKKEDRSPGWLTREQARKADEKKAKDAEEAAKRANPPPREERIPGAFSRPRF
jgi:hypothetical protein